MPTHRSHPQCTICETKITCRTSLSDTYLEFAFPCPECSSEIRLAYHIDPPNEEDVKIFRKMYGEIPIPVPPLVKKIDSFNAKMVYPATFEERDELEKDVKYIKMFDADHLINKGHDYTSGINPAMQVLPLLGFEKLQQFNEDQSRRRQAIRKLWTVIEQLLLHSQKKQWKFFDQAKAELGYKKEPITNSQRIEILYKVIEDFGYLFRRSDLAPYKEIKRRISLAETNSLTETLILINYYISKNKDIDLENQMHHIRTQWIEIYPILAPLYTTYYWDKSKYDLNNFTISQKRFVELKNFYIDCFETFCRISVIAATIEGIIRDGKAIVPQSKGRQMSIEQFDVFNNGSKPDILKNLNGFVANLFVPFIDHKLRNGIGHNSARYDVWRDEIDYANQNEKGIQRFSMPYILFCEKVLNLYEQLELVSLYLNWLSLKSYPIRNP